MSDISNIVTSLLGAGGTEYTSRIPAATRANILEVGNAIMDYHPMANDFLSTLYNKIVLQQIQTKIWNNPLAALKKGTMPFGWDIENSWINPATAGAYDRTGASLLSTSAPVVKTEYFRTNRQDVYKHTVWKDEMRGAFVSAEKFQAFVDGISQALYNGDYIDEYILMKRLLSDAVMEQKMRCANITAVTTAETATALLTAIRNVSSAFQYPSDAWNAWYKFNGTGTKITTWTAKEDQVLVIRSDMLNYVNVNVLSGMFNLSKGDFQNSIIEVDNFGEAANVLCMVLDKNAIFAVDKLFSGEDPFYNPEGRYWNLYLHHWQLLAMSLLLNGVAITDDGTADAAPVITEGGMVNGSTTAAGSAVTGSRVFLEIREADDTTLVKRYTVLAAGSAYSITTDAMVTGQKAHVWQVDLAGNKSPEDTFTIASGG